MAISATVSMTLPIVGETQVDVYCRVSEVRGNMTSMCATVDMFHNSSGGAIIDCKLVSFVPDPEDGNIVRQAYLHLKQLPEFAGATDC